MDIWTTRNEINSTSPYSPVILTISLDMLNPQLSSTARASGFKVTASMNFLTASCLWLGVTRVCSPTSFMTRKSSRIFWDNPVRLHSSGTSMINFSTFASESDLTFGLKEKEWRCSPEVISQNIYVRKEPVNDHRLRPVFYGQTILRLVIIHVAHSFTSGVGERTHRGWIVVDVVDTVNPVRVLGQHDRACRNRE